MVEKRLSSVPMTVPQTGTIHKQAKKMDIGANQAQAQSQPLIQTQTSHQPQTSPQTLPYLLQHHLYHNHKAQYKAQLGSVLTQGQDQRQML